MLIKRLAEIETKVMNSKLFTKSLVEDLEIISYNPPKQKQLHYYKDEVKKRKIVLHYTVGNLAGDFMTLTNPSKVSVAYLISRDGKVLELFDPKYWAYHLGPKALGGNEKQSSLSIGIEISNYGWLERRGDKLYTAYNEIYCTLDDKEFYTKAELPYRTDVFPAKFKEGQYWANFTDSQYVSVKKLLTILTTRFKIPYEFLPPERRLQYTNDVINFNGIVTHVNFRKDKWDIGPNFNWLKIQ